MQPPAWRSGHYVKAGPRVFRFPSALTSYFLGFSPLLFISFYYTFFSLYLFSFVTDFSLFTFLRYSFFLIINAIWLIIDFPFVILIHAFISFKYASGFVRNCTNICACEIFYPCGYAFLICCRMLRIIYDLVGGIPPPPSLSFLSLSLSLFSLSFFSPSMPSSLSLSLSRTQSNHSSSLYFYCPFFICQCFLLFLLLLPFRHSDRHPNKQINKHLSPH